MIPAVRPLDSLVDFYPPPEMLVAIGPLLELPVVVAVMSINVAPRFGLEHKGEIEVGMEATRGKTVRIILRGRTASGGQPAGELIRPSPAKAWSTCVAAAKKLRRQVCGGVTPNIPTGRETG
jgi:hypothetical protein